MPSAFGSLNGELRIALSGIFHLRAEAAAQAADIVEVLILIAGVHAQKIVLAGNFVHQQIVHEGTGGGHQAGVLRLALDKLGGVVAGDVLRQIQRLRAAQLDFAHMADVEKAGGRARGQMFADDPGVFHGHIPAAKVDHLGAQAAMRGVESGLAQLRAGGFDHE